MFLGGPGCVTGTFSEDSESLMCVSGYPKDSAGFKEPISGVTEGLKCVTVVQGGFRDFRSHFRKFKRFSASFRGVLGVSVLLQGVFRGPKQHTCLKEV